MNLWFSDLDKKQLIIKYEKPGMEFTVVSQKPKWY